MAATRFPAPLPDGDVLLPDHHGGAAQEEEEEAAEEQRRGPWTVDEDLTLVNYIADHGDGRWNSLARAAGLKRTGKSCRLRWLNYLRPDVKRGNFTADEQLLILDLHSRWGNRWSKIAQHLPGRTDNEIKNYWRTKVQKHAKQLNCDANSSRFKDAMRYLWMPRLLADQHHTAAADVAHGYAAAAASGRQLLAASMGYCVESSASAAASMVSSSTTSTESYDGGEFYAGVHAGELLVDGAAGDWMQQEASHHDGCLWPDQPITQEDSHGGFQVDQELAGWVQGFSDGLPDSFWSLDSIWKTQ